MTPRRQLLDDAANLVDGQRNTAYGDPSDDFARTAAMWSAYLGTDVEPHQVGIMLMLVKVSRSVESPHERDHYLDAAGYAACAWDCIDDEEEWLAVNLAKAREAATDWEPHWSAPSPTLTGKSFCQVCGEWEDD